MKIVLLSAVLLASTCTRKVEPEPESELAKSLREISIRAFKEKYVKEYDAELAYVLDSINHRNNIKGFAVKKLEGTPAPKTIISLKYQSVYECVLDAEAEAQLVMRNAEETKGNINAAKIVSPGGRLLLEVERDYKNSGSDYVMVVKDINEKELYRYDAPAYKKSKRTYDNAEANVSVPLPEHFYVYVADRSLETRYKFEVSPIYKKRS